MAESIYTNKDQDFYDFSKHFKVYVMKFEDRPEFYIRQDYEKES